MYRRFVSLMFRNAAISRSFVTCKPQFTKTFVENENDFAYSIIKSLGRPYVFPPATPVVVNTKIADLAGDSLPSFWLKDFQDFLMLSEDAKGTQKTIEDPSLFPIIRGLVAASSEMSDDHVIELISRLSDWPTTETTRTPNFKRLWNGLDTECVLRCPKWSTDQLLYVAGLWHRLKLNRITKYNTTMLHICHERLKEFDCDTLIRVLFYVNLQRQVSSSFMVSAEQKLSTDVRRLTLDQIAVAAMAFFKTRTRMTNHHLIAEIVAKTIAGLADAGQITLSAILKSLRFSSGVEYQDLFEHLQTSCVPHLSRFSPTLVMHLALLCQSESMCSPQLLSTMMREFGEQMNSVRLKELSRSMFCLSMFVPDQCVDYGRKIVDNLCSPQRADELDEYPGVTVSLVLSLAYVGVYSPILVNKCLDKHFLKSAKDKEVIDLQREAFVIDCSVGIESPEYNGNRMASVMKKKIFDMKHGKLNIKETHQSRLTSDVMNRFSMILGDSCYCHLCHILPHFQQQDLIMMTRKGGGFKPITATVRNMTPGTIIVPPVNEKWLAVVIGGRAFYERKSRNRLGPIAMKIRHLQRLGYTVIEIPWFSYDNLFEKQKDQSLRSKISYLL